MAGFKSLIVLWEFNFEANRAREGLVEELR
jgi:hypothetical protein